MTYPVVLGEVVVGLEAASTSPDSHPRALPLMLLSPIFYDERSYI